MAGSEWEDILSDTQGKENPEAKESEVHNSRGTAAMENKQFDKAIWEFQKAIKINDQVAFSHFNLGICYESVERFDEALKEFEHAVGLDKDLNMAAVKVDAMHQFKTLKSNINNIGAWLRLGLAQRSLGQFDDAIYSFEQALRLQPLAFNTYLQLGMCYHSKGWYDKALEMYKKSQELEPKNPDIHSNFGVTYFDLARYDEAIEAFNKAISISPNQALYHFNLGTCYESKGMKEDAKKEYRRTLELNPDLTMAKEALAAL